jgi:hypothetical protein
MSGLPPLVLLLPPPQATNPANISALAKTRKLVFKNE